MGLILKVRGGPTDDRPKATLSTRDPNFAKDAVMRAKRRRVTGLDFVVREPEASAYVRCRHRSQ